MIFFCKIFPLTMFFFVISAFAEPLAIAVSLEPYRYIVERIGGNFTSVTTLIPAGTDPHHFEPKPAVIKKFSSAKIYFSDSIGVDKAWLPRFQGANKNVKIINLAQGISLDENHHGEHHNEFDPHIWTSPKRALIVAENIAKALENFDEKNAKVYRENLMNFRKEIEKLEENLKREIEKIPPENRTFIVFHPAFGYFAKDYGLTQLAIELHGKEPKPKDLKKLIETGKKNQVRMVFVQPEFSTRSAEIIAKELGAVVQRINPLQANFLENTELLIQTIVNAQTK